MMTDDDLQKQSIVKVILPERVSKTKKNFFNESKSRINIISIINIHNLYCILRVNLIVTIKKITLTD